jgi:hypothetical protein
MVPLLGIPSAAAGQSHQFNLTVVEANEKKNCYVVGCNKGLFFYSFLLLSMASSCLIAILVGFSATTSHG